MHPAIATTGTIVTIEGRFGASATVVFPGDVHVAATVLGSSRISVAVPAEAKSGALYVDSDDRRLGPLPFRHPSFTTGITDYVAAYPQTGYAIADFPAGYSRSATVIGDFLYTFGNASPIGRQVIYPDGSLGPTVALPVSTLRNDIESCAVTFGHHLYLIGGFHSDGSPDLRVEHAVLDDSLTPGELTTVGQPTLVAARGGAPCQLIGHYVYLIGGGALLPTVERAAVGEDGTLGPFEVITSMLIHGRSGHATAVAGNYLYAFSGNQLPGVNVAKAGEHVSIDGNGDLGAFAAGPSTLIGRLEARSYTIDSTVYQLGGWTPEFLDNHDEYFDVDDTGAASTLPAFTTTISTTSTTLVGDAIISNSGLVSLDASGGLAASFAAQPASLVTARGGHVTYATPKFLYVLGGEGSGVLSSIERAPIDEDGGLGPFAVDPVALASGVTDAAAARVGTQLYVIGGRDGAGLVDTIQRATIGGDGALGSFAPTSAHLAEARACHALVATPGHLYAFGGLDADGCNRDIEVAPTTGNEVGAFAKVGTISNSGCVRALSTGSTLYVFGANGSESAPIASDGTIGAFVPSGGWLTPREAFSMFVAGRTVYALGGAQASGPLGSLEKAAFAPGAALGSFGAVSTTLITPRSDHTTTVVKNHVYVIGGVDASAAPLATIEQADLR